MAMESEEMAIWGSIIHWWELCRMPPYDTIGMLGAPTCALCRRHRSEPTPIYSESECENCILYKAVGKCETSNGRNPYRAAFGAAVGGDESEWKKQSNKMLRILLTLVDIHLEHPKTAEPDYD